MEACRPGLSVFLKPYCLIAKSCAHVPPSLSALRCRLTARVWGSGRSVFMSNVTKRRVFEAEIQAMTIPVWLITTVKTIYGCIIFRSIDFVLCCFELIAPFVHLVEVSKKMSELFPGSFWDVKPERRSLRAILIRIVAFNSSL